MANHYFLKSGVALAILSLVLSGIVAPFSTRLSAAAPVELYISEYIEGTSNNKAIEIYNGTGSAIDLAQGGYNLQMYFNGSVSAGLTINLTGTVTAGDVYVLAHSSAVAAILAQADQTNGAGWYNGDDAIVLRKGTTLIDVIGQIGFDPGAEWGSGLTSTADNTLRRKHTICAGDPLGNDAFDPAVEWDGYAIDSFAGLGVHTAELQRRPGAGRFQHRSCQWGYWSAAGSRCDRDVQRSSRCSSWLVQPGLLAKRYPPGNCQRRAADIFHRPDRRFLAWGCLHVDDLCRQCDRPGHDRSTG